MKKIVLGVLFVGLSININAAVVDTVSEGYGVFAISGTSIGGSFNIDSAGGEYQSSASVSENTNGISSASVSYDNSARLLPTLAANAISDDTTKPAFATAFGVQAYHYNGVGESITLAFNLHGSVGDNPPPVNIDPNAPIGFTNNQLFASVFVVITDQLDWSGNIEDIDLATFPVGTAQNASVFINDGDDQNRPDTLTFDVATDQNFYILASITAISSNGYATALNTFSMNFQNANNLNLVAASLNIPIPANILLLSFGLILMRLKNQK